jgi:signal transduction histidine kinase
LLHRALENLISNAFKYGDGGLVTVRAQAAQGRLMLSVHNTGNPIAADRLDRIFEYLWREVDGKTNKATQGWGIGLPFARSVAEGHGGSIAVDSGPDTGTTFLIDVPIDCRPFVKSA